MRSVQPADVAELRTVACPVCGWTSRGSTLGFKVVRDRTVIGFVAVSASDAASNLPQGSASIDQLWVHPDDVGELVGTQLVQRVAGHLNARGVRLLVARGTRGASDCRHLPGAWLERMGFVEHVRGVQWRLDLRRTVPVVDAARAAWATLVRLARPERPSPATGRTARGAASTT